MLREFYRDLARVEADNIRLGIELGLFRPVDPLDLRLRAHRHGGAGGARAFSPSRSRPRREHVVRELLSIAFEGLRKRGWRRARSRNQPSRPARRRVPRRPSPSSPRWRRSRRASTKSASRTWRRARASSARSKRCRRASPSSSRPGPVRRPAPRADARLQARPRCSMRDDRLALGTIAFGAARRAARRRAPLMLSDRRGAGPGRRAARRARRRAVPAPRAHDRGPRGGGDRASSAVALLALWEEWIVGQRLVRRRGARAGHRRDAPLRPRRRRAALARPLRGLAMLLGAVVNRSRDAPPKIGHAPEIEKARDIPGPFK